MAWGALRRFEKRDTPTRLAQSIEERNLQSCPPLKPVASEGSLLAGVALKARWRHEIREVERSPAKV